MSDAPMTQEVVRDRLSRARARMDEISIDTLLLSVGADLPYLTGYEAVPLERLTMLVLPLSGDVELVVPRLEAPRVSETSTFEITAWDDSDDPVAIVARRLGNARNVAIGDHTWSRFLLELQRALPRVRWRSASDVTKPLRMVKDAAEITALRNAARAVDEIATEMRSRPFGGRRESEIRRELVERMLDAGHDKANFAIVAAGENAASPHHDAGARLVGQQEIVLCDFGGTMARYCSDITRMFFVGEPSAEITDAYAVLQQAQEAGVAAAVVGASCESVDMAARQVIDDAGLGDRFVHRVGHGIGTEAHEDPYLVSGNAQVIEPGHVFSVEPGIYLPGRFGMRLEDIVVATEKGPDRLNRAPRDLALVA